MQTHGVVQHTYEADRHEFVQTTPSVQKVATAALKNIPGSQKILDHHFAPIPRQSALSRPKIMNQKMYGAFDFGR